ncbi:hypothetical protein [Mycoplana sp. MJR14]|uniref:hypothetical protein n=1 Tax=Mycoplana sp. MJR14 TaxID=3032583 RepID=UPI000DDB3559|nr:hypothetical protein [Mycoplana sp. MJR14]MDF1631529.1 hypothetical protein [Mycoplana sp. MJR14]
MDTLILKVATRMIIGFVIGCAALAVLIYVHPQHLGHTHGINYLGLALQVYGFGLPFAVGFLCTSFVFEPDDRLDH